MGFDMQGLIDEEAELQGRVLEFFNITDPALLNEEFLKQQSDDRLGDVQELLQELEEATSREPGKTKHTKYHPMVPIPLPSLDTPLNVLDAA